MAKPNYQFEKRQRELAKKKKKEEKLQQRRSGTGEAGSAEGEDAPTEDGEASEPTESGGETGESPSAEASA